MPTDPITTDRVPSAAPATASRRAMLRSTGLGAAAIGGLAAGVSFASSPAAAAATITDADVLNFALNLEYLEAEFYLRATTGMGLTDAEAGGTGAGSVTGGSAVPFANTHIAEIANDIAEDEHQHVTFLRAALGAAAVKRPKINFTDAFNTLARAAGVVGPTGTFNPFADDYSFLIGAYIFEDVGVTAYHGGAGLITNKDYLSAAAGILAVEAYHAGVLRLSILRSTNAVIATAGKVSALRAKLSGKKDDSGPVVTRGAYNLAPTDANGIAFARTPGQVLNIVYGNTTATPGLFFPNGLNGVVR